MFQSFKQSCLLLFTSSLIIISTEKISANPINQVQIPLHFSQDTPYFDITLNGQAARLELDTGSSNGLHLVKKKILQFQDIALLPEKSRSIDLTGKINYADKYNIPQLDINGLILSNIELEEFQPWGLNIGEKEHIETDGIAGTGLFKDHQIIIDYSRKLLTIATTDIDLKTTSDAWQEIPLKISPQGLEITLNQDNKAYSFLIDTGASISASSSITLPNAQTVSCKTAKLNIELEDKPCKAFIFDITNSEQKIAVFDLAIFNQDMANLGRHSGLLGSNFFQENKVLINFKTQQLFIAKQE